jgi:hypothetical protein
MFSGLASATRLRSDALPALILNNGGREHAVHFAGSGEIIPGVGAVVWRLLIVLYVWKWLAAHAQAMGVLSPPTIGVLPGCRAHVAKSPKESVPSGLIRKTQRQSDCGEIQLPLI